MNPDYFEDEQEQIAYESRISKKVFLQQKDDFQTAQQTTIMFYYNASQRQIDFARTMNEFFTNQYNNLKQCQVFFFDSNTKYFTFVGVYPFQKQIFIKYQDFQQDTIHIKYHPISYEDLEQPKVINKKPRVKERTINDVLKLVAQWRDIHNAKNITLEQAAKQIGLPKKSLDDYYQQIKLAETYLFDFEHHLESGIGVLRKYVKQKHEKKKAVELNILKKYSGKIQEKKEEFDSSEQEEEEQEEEEEQDEEEECEGW